MRTFLCLAALVAACPLAVSAAESYDACTFEITTLPAVLSTQGTWCLKADRSTAITTGAAITITANNVTLDCNGFKLGGLSAGPLTGTSAIVVNGRTNTTIRHCNVRGFRYGVNAEDSVSTTIEDNRFEFNTTTPIWLKGVAVASSIVARNRISDTQFPISSGNAFALIAEGGVDIVDNVIDGVRPGGISENFFATGMYLTSARGTVIGNRMRGLESTGIGETYGIYASGGKLAIDRNYIHVDETAGAAYALFCDSDGPVVIENRLSGDAVPITGCANSNNYLDAE